MPSTLTPEQSVFLSKHSERRTVNREVQPRHFLIELFRQEVQISLAGLGFLPTPEQIMLRQHLVREEHDNKKEGCQWRDLNC